MKDYWSIHLSVTLLLLCDNALDTVYHQSDSTDPLAVFWQTWCLLPTDAEKAFTKVFPSAVLEFWKYLQTFVLKRAKSLLKFWKEINLHKVQQSQTSWCASWEPERPRYLHNMLCNGVLNILTCSIENELKSWRVLYSTWHGQWINARWHVATEGSQTEKMQRRVSQSFHLTVSLSVY